MKIEEIRKESFALIITRVPGQGRIMCTFPLKDCQQTCFW